MLKLTFHLQNLLFDDNTFLMLIKCNKINNPIYHNYYNQFLNFLQMEDFI